MKLNKEQRDELSIYLISISRRKEHSCTHQFLKEYGIIENFEGDTPGA